MRISDWSSDVCSSDLPHRRGRARPLLRQRIFSAVRAPDRRRRAEARAVGDLPVGRHRKRRRTAPLPFARLYADIYQRRARPRHEQRPQLLHPSHPHLFDRPVLVRPCTLLTSSHYCSSLIPSSSFFFLFFFFFF